MTTHGTARDIFTTPPPNPFGINSWEDQDENDKEEDGQEAYNPEVR